MNENSNTRAHRPAIFIPAYKRVEALSRLLHSLNNASYPNGGVNLFISIDGDAADDVLGLASKFQFVGGTCHVIKREKNIGLREHLLWCGNQSQKYGSVIVLEDDLVVDPYFYQYAMAALTEYDEVGEVSGISLYAQRYNEYIGLPFEPMYNGTSAYFMKVPCSWGQAWTKRQWSVFKEWYGEGGRGKVENCLALPSIIKGWPESSWKKYYAAFLAETGRYVVYPYQSYTSNCAGYHGTHMKDRTNLYQVPLGHSRRKCEVFNFPAFEVDALAYDSFMEPEAGHTASFLGVPRESLEMDMYGYKPEELVRRKTFVLTSRRTTEAIISYPLAYKPIEKNIEYPCEKGGGVFCLAETDKVDYSVLPKYAELMDYETYFPLVTRRSMPYILKKFVHEIWKALSRRT